MKTLNDLFANNRAWAKGVSDNDPSYFAELAKDQQPQYLWIGCSDSRILANTICGVSSGQMFVHRNIANLVVHTDLNCLSVMQFAVDLLRVKHIIVCGHYGCSGVRACLRRDRLGLSDNWLRHVEDVRLKHEARMADAVDEVEAHNRLCELNAIEQAANVCTTTIARDAWDRGQELTVHAWCYGLQDGLLRDLEMNVSETSELTSAYASAIGKVGSDRSVTSVA